MPESSVTRRLLLTAGAVIGSSTALGQLSAEAKSISGEEPWQPGAADAPTAIVPGAPTFLTADEATFLDAALARLIPADDLGPGAKEAGVTTFIDRQLAGAYGQAATWYMRGPWAEGSATQGFQTRLTPAQIYRTAIASIDDHCRKTFGDKSFAGLAADDQDKVLAGLEKGEIKLDAIDAVTFFTMLLQNTIEGFFSDPLYGGNRDMVGWKLIGFPGARYDYRPYVAKHNQKLDLPPVSIHGRPGWTTNG